MKQQSAPDLTHYAELWLTRPGDIRVSLALVPRCRDCALRHRHTRLGILVGSIMVIVGLVAYGILEMEILGGLLCLVAPVTGLFVASRFAGPTRAKLLGRTMYDKEIVEYTLQSLADGTLQAGSAEPRRMTLSNWRPGKTVSLSAVFVAFAAWAALALSLAPEGALHEMSEVEQFRVITGLLALFGAMFVGCWLCLHWILGREERRQQRINALRGPWPGSPICFYCCQARMTHQFEYPFHRETGRGSTEDWGGGYTVTKEYEPASVLVPRCDACRNLHIQSQRRLYWGGGLIGAGSALLILGVYLSTLLRGTDNPATIDVLASALLSGGVLVPGFVLLFQAEGFQKRGIRSYQYSHVADHPEYVRLCKAGFSPGKDPFARAEVTPSG